MSQKPKPYAPPAELLAKITNSETNPLYKGQDAITEGPWDRIKTYTASKLTAGGYKFDEIDRNHFQPQEGADDVLVVVPTKKDNLKNDLLTNYVKHHVKQHNSKHPRQVFSHNYNNIATNVGEQPYDEAGEEGACNRIENTIKQINADLKARNTALYEEIHKQGRNIGHVIVAAVENYLVRPKRETVYVDYGIIMIYNATLRLPPWIFHSKGVEFPRDCVEEAQKLGFVPGNRNHGKVTAGEKIYEKHKDQCQGLKSGNPHVWITGVSRFTILDDAMEHQGLIDLAPKPAHQAGLAAAKGVNAGKNGPGTVPPVQYAGQRH